MTLKLEAGLKLVAATHNPGKAKELPPCSTVASRC
jgi:XTP/dITP diphosphohydrolase